MLPIPDLLTSLRSSFSEKRREKDYTLQGCFKKMSQTKIMFSAMRKGISWTKFFPTLSLKQLEHLEDAGHSMNEMVAPLMFPALIGKSIKLYKLAANLRTGSVSKKIKESGKLALLSGSIACKSIKTFLWIDKMQYKSSKTHLLFSNSSIKGLKIFNRIVSPILAACKFIQTIENVVEIFSEKEELTSDKKKFILFKLAHQTTSLALGIIDCLALLFGLIISPILLLSLSTFVLVCKITKVFFKKQNEVEREASYFPSMCLAR